MSEELKERILGLIYGADWSFRCRGYQNEFDSDLELDALRMEDEAEVVESIITAVHRDLVIE